MSRDQTSAGDEPADARDAQLDARLAQLERAFGEISARLHAVEEHLVAAGPPAPAPVRPFGQGSEPHARGEGARPEVAPLASAEPLPAAHAASAREEAQATAPVGGDASAGATHEATHEVEVALRVDATGARASETSGASGGKTVGGAHAAPRARRDFESVVGGSWFNWLGIIAVALGVGFFLKYAFESDWVGAAGRVAFGAAAGVGILALAGWLRARGYRSYAHVLTGGGILVLYLSVYAARVFYDLVGVAPAFLLMVAVTALAVLLSVRYDARAVAVLGLAGGFLTPLLLSTHVDNQLALFTYVALLDAGVLAVAYFKRWRVLDHLAYAATVLTFAAWSFSYYSEPKLGRTLFFLTLFFLMFATLAVVHFVLPRRPARWLDVSLAASNASLYFAAAYALLADGHHAALPVVALLLSAFYAALFLFTYRLNRADKLLALAYVVAAVTFLTIAVAMRFDQHWLTIGWATEGLLLTWAGLRAGLDAPRRAALPVFAFAVLHWLTTDLPGVVVGADSSFVPLANSRALSCAALVVAMGLGAWLYHRAGQKVRAGERAFVTAALTLAANALALTLLTADAWDYFDQKAARVEVDTAGTYSLHVNLDNTKHLAVTLIWTLYAVGLFAAGLRRRLTFLRLAGLAWLAVTAAKIILIDSSFYDAAWHAPVFNQTFAAFALFTLAVWYVARAYARADFIDERERRIAVPALTVVGNLFAVVALSLEASGYFSKQLAEREQAGASVRDLRLAKQLSLSLVWAAYGGAMLAYGHVRQNQLLRVLALLLLIATTVKVFFLDLSELERFYRIVSFIALGLVLLAVSFLYQQRQRRATKAEADAG